MNDDVVFLYSKRTYAHLIAYDEKLQRNIERATTQPEIEQATARLKDHRLKLNFLRPYLVTPDTTVEEALGLARKQAEGRSPRHSTDLWSTSSANRCSTSHCNPCLPAVGRASLSPHACSARPGQPVATAGTCHDESRTGRYNNEFAATSGENRRTAGENRRTAGET